MGCVPDELGSRREAQGTPTERPGLLRACPVSPSAAVAAERPSHCVHFHRLVWASEMGTKVPGHAPKVARIRLQGVPECPRTPEFGPPRHSGKSIFRPPGTLPGPSPPRQTEVMDPSQQKMIFKILFLTVLGKKKVKPSFPYF